MLDSNESEKLFRVAKSAGEILDVLAEEDEHTLQFPAVAQGLANALLNVTERTDRFEVFQLETSSRPTDELKLIEQLAEKAGVKDWRDYLQGLIYLTAKNAGLPADESTDVPAWVGRIPKVKGTKA
jgi:hypothetical protein